MRFALCIAALHLAAGLAPRLATNNKRRIAALAAIEAEAWDATNDAATLAKRRETFRTEIWRKRPLLVRNAVAAEALRAACDVDDVAGLACEPDVASRLVDAALRVTTGPFDEDRLAALPEDVGPGFCVDTIRLKDEGAP